MNIWNSLVCVVVVGFLSTQVNFAIAQDDESIYGTYSVVFQTGQSGGELHSCTMVYTAMQADYAYKNGNPIMINGNISLRQFNGKNMILTMKIGVKDFGAPNSQFTRPYFAYLQTPNVTTVKSSTKIGDGDEGYRLIVIDINDTTEKLLIEMLESGKVTIGFNREKGGLDVIVPIDLKVFDAEYQSSGKVIRKRSDETIIQFIGCYKELLGMDSKDVTK